MARTRTQTNFSPAIIASGVLHGLIAAALLIAWLRNSTPITLGSAVPVTVVATGPTTDIRPAEQGPEEQVAQTEEPVPETPPAPAAPVPTPTPAPPKPAAAKPTPQPALNLDALAASIQRRQ